MRIPYHRTIDSDRGDATMTPMIDVVFLLLIFFICTASFQIAEQLLPSNLRIESTAGTTKVQVIPEDMEDLEEILIHLAWNAGQPSWTINDEQYTSLGQVRQVLAIIAQVDTEVPVILDVDGEVPLGYVIDLYDVSLQARFTKIQFAASV